MSPGAAVLGKIYKQFFLKIPIYIYFLTMLKKLSPETFK